ncbi:hypothetical protein K469DRAFT_733695 [Zopfia rhizophila CBS 207.26]|uniref:Uncharacterized protein n=1 Tax=Zopfia rhizophila CBS 207.26 TaxID=1314779 RepID=A0A6A6DAN3_9PEZI|nr:hypothetical protein K469DRAFT_733695 [Zopfia rhizophila CBS 207.26]
MDWQEKDMLIINKVSMLGAWILYTINKRLYTLQGYLKNFSGIPVILYQHNKAHALWKRFTIVVILKDDIDFLNHTCFREGRNWWNLNVEAILSFQKQHWGRLTEEEAIMILNYGDDSSILVPAVFMFVSGMLVVVNQNTHQGLKLVNGASYRVSADSILHFGPLAGILLALETTIDFRFRNDITRKGLPCTAAFACTDYKVQGTRTTNINGQAVPSQCDPYSLYMQLSRCTSLGGIMLLSKARERDVVGNTVPESMDEAEKRLEELSEATIKEAEENWLDWDTNHVI